MLSKIIKWFWRFGLKCTVDNYGSGRGSLVGRIVHDTVTLASKTVDSAVSERIAWETLHPTGYAIASHVRHSVEFA